MDNETNVMNDFNSETEPKVKNKPNICAILAIILGALSLIPCLNFVFLLPAIVLGIIAICVNKKRKKGLVIASSIVVAVSVICSVLFLVIAILSGLIGSMMTKDFNDMYSDIEYKSWCEIASDGSWMEIDTNPYDLDDEFEMEAVNKIKSINIELGFGSYVYEEMLDTRSIDGRQTASTEEYTVTWTYHPDRGLEVMYKINP